MLVNVVPPIERQAILTIIGQNDSCKARIPGYATEPLALSELEGHAFLPKVDFLGCFLNQWPEKFCWHTGLVLYPNHLK